MVPIGDVQGKRQPVSIMLCGPTVYDNLHVGHARMLLTYDLVARILRYAGHSVEVLLNTTDIDAKIFQKSLQRKVPPAEISDWYFREMLRDLARLNISEFTLAKVSNYMGYAGKLVQELLSEGLAYYSAGRYYLRTGHDPGWGGISHMSHEEIQDCRLDIAESKHSAHDILIWSAAEDAFDICLRGQEKPPGIPWWHMQDTSVAMANYAGAYDLQGGAGELAYPHHESQRAQLAAITGRDSPVRAFTYVGLVTGTAGTKMSKSLGNTVRLTDAVAASSANALRLFCFSSSYSKPLKFSWEALQKFEKKDRRVMGSILSVAEDTSGGSPNSKLMGRFIESLCEDLDTVSALEILDLALSDEDPSALEMARLLGLRY
ncbi:MAG: class I tRNA ligase family protein [Nitrososphaera sp.]